MLWQMVPHGKRNVRTSRRSARISRGTPNRKPATGVFELNCATVAQHRHSSLTNAQPQFVASSESADTNKSAEGAHCFSRSVFKDGDAPFGHFCKRAELSLDATKHTVHGAWFAKDLVGSVGLMRSQANAYPSFASSVGRKPKNTPLA